MAFLLKAVKVNIKIREENNINIIDIEGEIDINSSEIIETIGWLLKNKRTDILLNLSKVEMVDYSGISILAIAYKNVINHNGKMSFCNVPLHVEKLFEVVGLDAVFTVYRDEKTAIETFHLESPIDKKVLRRRFKRLDAHIEIEFCPVEELKKDEKKIWHIGKLINVSGEGLFLFTKKILNAGTEVRLKIDLHAKKPLEINGIVIWVADRSLQPQLYPGMGIYFKDIRKQEQDRIVEFIDKHITHRSTSS